MNPVPRPTRHSLADMAYDAIYIGGIGGGLVALFFLVFDMAVRRDPFFTPSVMGVTLFGRTATDATAAFDMMAVAKYTVVHFLVFGLLGVGLSYLTHLAEMRSKHPLMVMGVVFVILEGGFWLASFMVPGVIERVGGGAIAVANLIAAAGIALFLVRTHTELWKRAKENLPPPLQGAASRTETSRQR